MRVKNVAEQFWVGQECKLGTASRRLKQLHSRYFHPRDRVEVNGNVVNYLLWGDIIASLDKTKKTLVVCDGGWRTPLTRRRLNYILSPLGWRIYSDRRQWYIYNFGTNESFVWAPHQIHKINLENKKITPAKPRRFNPKISKGLRKFYQNAREKTRKGILITQTAGRTCAVIVDRYHQLFKTRIVGIHVEQGAFDIRSGEINSSIIYAGFMAKNAFRIFQHLPKKQLPVNSAMLKLSFMGFPSEKLPAAITSILATAKLLENNVSLRRI